MDPFSHTEIDFDATNYSMSKIYYERQAKILDKIPKKISSNKDVYKVKTPSRDKLKSATKVYDTIKKKFLFKLDEIGTESIETKKELYNKIIDNLTQKETKLDIKQSIDITKESRKQVHEIIINYNDFTWFRDSNLLSTIRFHEKLNEIFLSKAEESLDYNIEKTKIELVVKDLLEHPDYIKALIVITFQPILAYGAIFAAIHNDYEYIIKYESVISEAAEILFYYDPNLKMRFFKQELT